MTFSNKIKPVLLLIVCLLMIPVLASCDGEYTVDGVTYDSNNWVISCDESVTSVALVDGTVGIKSGAFRGCTALTNISIPDSVSTVMKHAFDECDALMVEVDSVYYVDGWAVKADTSIETVSLKDGTVGIANEAFHGCSSLKSFSAPKTLRHIGGHAFFGCNAIEDITLPFLGSAQGSTFDGHIGYLFGAGSADSNDTYTPDTLKRITLTCTDTIASDAFRACSSITEVVLPDGVTSIGDSAFRGCTSLKTVRMPDSVTEIGSHAFRLCSSLSEIYIPEGVATINQFCFTECISLREVTLPDSITEIKACAFGLCENVESLTLSKNLTYIGQEAFRGCSYITEISIESGRIGIGAFYECQSLNTVMLGDEVTEIGDNAFSKCGELSTLGEPKNLTKIGKEAFFYCLSLKEYDIPDGVTEIGSKAFYYCTSLSRITIPDSVTEIGADAFTSCSRALYSKNDEITVVDGWITQARPSVTTLIIDETIKGIANSVFAKTKNLTAIYAYSADVWSKIAVGSTNSRLTAATLYVYSENEPTTDGSFWHYVDGVPISW